MKKINILLSVILFAIASCTVYETPDSIKLDGGEESLITVSRKVLWINIDGALSEVVRDKAPQNGSIAAMLQNSKTLWTGMSEERQLSREDEEDPVTWASMLLGVCADKHRITDDSYAIEPVTDPTNPGGKVTSFQNVFGYITNLDNKMKTFAVTPWKKLNERMLNTASAFVTTTEDEQTQQVAVESLTNDNNTLTLVAFKGMLDAGKNGGFTASNSRYTDALATIDGYISEMLDSICNRPDYYYEDWLVIVTSNHGGTPDGHYSGVSDPERDIFGIFYYPHYKGVELKGEFLTTGIFPRGQFKAVVIDSCDQRYTLRPGRSFTVEWLMAWKPEIPTSNGYYCGSDGSVIGKGNYSGNGSGVWRFGVWHSLGWELLYNPGGGERVNSSYGWGDNLFHTYAASMTGKDKDIISRCAFDGGSWAFYEWSKTGTLAFDDSTNFYFGTPGSNNALYAAEVRIWAKESSADDLKNSEALLDLETNAPSLYNNNLVGYWRFLPKYVDNQHDSIIHSAIPSGPDINLPYSIKFARRPNTFRTNIEQGKIVMENTLILPQIIYWLGFEQPKEGTSKDNKFDAPLFINRYVSEEDWRGSDEDNP
jgi:hypothetical protein